jgi:Holliday junction resolvase RusA-like endonuclease
MLTFTVPGQPVAQGRGRAVAMKTPFGARARVIDPEKSRDWKRTLGTIALETMRARNLTPFPAGVPLEVEVVAVFSRPKSIPKREGAQRKWRPSKPDADNVAKAVLDGLNGIAYPDDSAVVALRVWKFVAAAGEDPNVRITILEAGLVA